jgi:hypothetical protein
MAFRNFFKDKKGNIVIVQKPNFLIWVAILFFILQAIFNGDLTNIANWGFKITILIWSLDELFRGDSNFRKFLGLLVGILTTLTIINSFS